MSFKIYDVVRLIAINSDELCLGDAFNTRPPQVGDIATILEIYDNPPGFELECSDKLGGTVWLLGFQEKDVQLELVNI
ncbi:hypothetical protein [Undibacterium danionis]|uniref:DUF4926 domain-containing protein n=1 Tax=Undibacterium danionis TaxID=1812100 RepID=A0ABV6IGU7_9BURK